MPDHNISEHNIISQTHLLMNTHTAVPDPLPAEALAQPAEPTDDEEPKRDTEQLSADENSGPLTNPAKPVSPASSEDSPSLDALHQTSEDDVPSSSLSQPVAPINFFFPDMPITHPSSAADLSLYPYHHTTSKGGPSSPKDPGEPRAGLATLLAGLHHYFYPRCEPGDLEVLSFCFQHLLACATRLYETILPELTAHNTNSTGQLHEGYNLLTTCCIWTQLHSLSGLLARIESLTHLSISAILNMLDALDITGLPHQVSTILDRHNSNHHPPTPSTPQPQQWEQATEQIRTCLQTWEQNLLGGLTFTSQFPHIPHLDQELARLDICTEQMLTHTRMIFGELLPALRELTLDNETAAALLFDLAQQIDQIQIAVSSQQEPLLTLLQEYALRVVV